MRAQLTSFLLGIMALCTTVPAAAALLSSVDSQTAPAQAPTAAQAIETGNDAESDERIGRRIEGIFGAVPALENVTVSVNAGVVTLEGKVPTTEDIDRAEQIASRVLGVATVENSIERDLSVGDSIETLGGLSEKLSSFWKMLPLIGSALLVALIVAAFGYLVSSIAWVWQRLTPSAFLAELIASAIRFIFVIGGIVVALQILGAGSLLGAVLGGAGIIGIALGFAMRDTIENYVASVMLSLRQPFRANDWVVIDAYEGRVIRLTSRATILMTLDGNHLRIPNSTVFKAVILNYTRNPQRRFDFELGIDADDDPRVAMKLGIDVLAGLDFVLADPEPASRITNVGDSNIVIQFLAWIDQAEADWYKSRSLAIPAVKDALEEAGFALPEPIYRLRFDSRTGPLPFADITKSGVPSGAAEADSQTPPIGVSAEPHLDVAPADEISQMVEQERRSAGEQKTDLLDPKRPVE